jgi:hypothetical protein
MGGCQVIARISLTCLPAVTKQQLLSRCLFRGLFLATSLYATVLRNPLNSPKIGASVTSVQIFVNSWRAVWNLPQCKFYSLRRRTNCDSLCNFECCVIHFHLLPSITKMTKDITCRATLQLQLLFVVERAWIKQQAYENFAETGLTVIMEEWILLGYKAV